MRRVLFIAYYFPPDGGAGTQRTAKFCKYLANFGWSPIVVTRTPGGRPNPNAPEDRALLAELSPDAQVIRVAAGHEPADWAVGVANIDIARDWLEPAFAAARDAIRRLDPSVAVVTMSPFDLSFVGRHIQRETRVPVVYDLRDPWALDGWRLHGTRSRWRRDFAAMIGTLSEADGVIANTPDAAAALRAVLPNLSADRLTTITNGYDADDFTAQRPQRHVPADRRQFRIVHTGTFHADTLYKYDGVLGLLKRIRHYRPEPIDPSGRTPVHLLEAVRRLQAGGDPAGNAVRLAFVGGADDAIRRCVRESGLAAQVELTGYVPHPDSVRAICHADALFLPLHRLPPGRRSRIVPGKTYEYLATGRPILACLPEGDARDFVLRCGRAYCASPCDPDDIADALSRLYTDWSDGRLDERTPPPPEFERRELTGRLAAFLDRYSGKVSGAVGRRNDAGSEVQPGVVADVI